MIEGVEREPAGAGRVVGTDGGGGGAHGGPRRVRVVQRYRLVSEGELGPPAHPTNLTATSAARDYNTHTPVISMQFTDAEYQKIISKSKIESVNGKTG